MRRGLVLSVAVAGLSLTAGVGRADEPPIGARGSIVVPVGDKVHGYLRGGETHVFIHPGHRFQLVDAMVTNFHLPRSSLLMLVAALAGREKILTAYREAVERGYSVGRRSPGSRTSRISSSGSQPCCTNASWKPCSVYALPSARLAVECIGPVAIGSGGDQTCSAASPSGSVLPSPIPCSVTDIPTP